jgi:hypothetical protein
MLFVLGGVLRLLRGGCLYPTSGSVYHMASEISASGKKAKVALVVSKVMCTLFCVIYSYNLVCIDDGKDIVS